MEVVTTPNDLISRRDSWDPVSVGFVPTMGALHAGHLSLVERSRAENRRVVVSIFVNPTQFDDPQDLANYPKTWGEDVDLLKAAGVDLLFAPTPSELYPDQYRFRLIEQELSQKFCGAHRPGHFAGVLTVVMKLIQLVRPDRAYFGEKDWQQLCLVRDMAKAFFLRTEIVPCPTLRESDGLAMSSRNRRLTAADRTKAPRLAEILRRSPSAQAARERLTEEGFVVDYVADQLTEGQRRRLGAVRLGEVRLIDNLVVEER